MSQPTGLPLDAPDEDAGGLEVVGIEQLIPDPKNARRHTQRNLDTVEKSIEEVGLWRSVAIDENNIIVAGNATVEIAGQMGIGKVRIVEANGDEIIAVRRRGLTDEQKRRYGMFDNRSAEHAEWDVEQLAEFHAEGVDFHDLFSDKELAELLAQATLPFEEMQTIDDKPIVVPTQPITRQGDLYILGDHILMCGDCRDGAAAHRLLGEEYGAVQMVFTDPPYNVKYVGKTEEKLEISNDRMTDDEFIAFLNETWVQMWDLMAPGCCYFVCHPGGPLSELFYRTLRDSKLGVRQQIIWAKNSMVLGHSDFHYKHEPIAYGWKEGTRYNCGDRTLTTLWEVDRPSASRDHPTMKPTKLVSLALNAASKPGDIVYDGFGGSGSTLLACETMGRRARLMELDPVYCDVIVKRWAELTGGEPRVLRLQESVA